MLKKILLFLFKATYDKQEYSEFLRSLEKKGIPITSKYNRK